MATARAGRGPGEGSAVPTARRYVRTSAREAASRRAASADRYRFLAHDLNPRSDRGTPRAERGTLTDEPHDLSPAADRDSPHAAVGSQSNGVHDPTRRSDLDTPHAAAENRSDATHEPSPGVARRSPHGAGENQSSAAHDPSSADDRRSPHGAAGNQSSAAHDPTPAACRGNPHAAVARTMRLRSGPRRALTCAEPHRGLRAQNSSLGRIRPGEGEVSRRTSCCCARPSFPRSNGPSWADHPWSVVGTTWAPERSPRRDPFGRHLLPSALTSPEPARTAVSPIPIPQLPPVHRRARRVRSNHLVLHTRTRVSRRFRRSPRRLGVLCLRRLGHHSPGRHLPDPSPPIEAHHLKIGHVLPNPDDRPRPGGRLCVRCRPVCSRRHPALTAP